MVRQARLWIAVVDGEHARLVQRAEDNALHTQEMVDSPQAHQSASDLGSERPGRSFESASPTRHSIPPRNDLHEQAQVDFAPSMAARLNAADQDGAFDQLVLVVVLADHPLADRGSRCSFGNGTADVDDRADRR